MLPAFGWPAAITHWQFGPVVTAATVAAAVLYVWGTWRVARRHPARPWPRWRTWMFLAGLAVVVIATQSGIGSYDEVLFWDHMVQHLLLLMIAPPLLVAGQPFTLLLHASRNPLHTWVKRFLRSRLVAVLTWPPFGLAAYAITVAGTHLTSLTSQIPASPLLHDLEHVLYLVVGYLFFLPLLGREPIRWRLSYLPRLLVLALAMPVDTFTGLVLGYTTSGTYTEGPRPPGAPGPVQDVHWGGAIMWIAGDAIMFALMLLVLLAWSRERRASWGMSGWLEAARKARFDEVVTPGGAAAARPGRGGIDDDEHLAAYNAYLARLNGPGAERAD